MLPAWSAVYWGVCFPMNFTNSQWRRVQQCGQQLPLRGVSPPGHGQGEGSAGDKFRVSGTQETVEGAGASVASGVLEGTDCCRCCALRIKKEADPF